MTVKIVQKMEPLLFVGGGPVDGDDLVRGLRLCCGSIALDHGLAALLAQGAQPLAAIGDMDSVNPELLKQVPLARQHWIAEQDDTDFEKALLRVSAPLILAVGFRGGRFDHELAALHALLRFAEQPVVLIGRGELVFLCPPRLSLTLRAGDPVSLFPLRGVSASVAGLHWSFDALTLEPGRRIGTSNFALGAVDMSVNAPGLLCIVPDSALDEVTDQLLAAPGWPVVRE